MFDKVKKRAIKILEDLIRKNKGKRIISPFGDYDYGESYPDENPEEWVKTDIKERN